MSIKISELPVASSVNSADIVPIVQDGTTKQAQAEMFKPQIETVINSSSTNNKPVGAKAVYDYSAPIKHDSETQEYGVATTTKYGHTKIIDSLDSSSYQVGESLSAYQGAVLKQSIDNINDDIGSITDELATKQTISNMTNKLDESSTNTQYPNAKVTYEKYNELLAQIPTATATGNPINVQDSSNLPIKDFTLLGNATQADTPTPDTPQDIHVVTGDNTVNIGGKNILQISTFVDNSTTKSGNGVTATINSDGSITLTGTASANINWYFTKNDFASLIKGNFYYLCNAPSANCRIELACKIDGTTAYLNDYGTGNKRNATTSFEFSSLKLIVNSGAATNVTLKPMVALGTTVTEWTPYITPTTQLLSLGSIELAKIGDYTDRIFKDSGKWYVEKALKKVVLDGQQNVAYYYAPNKSIADTVSTAYFTLVWFNDSLNGKNVLCNALSTPYNTANEIWGDASSTTESLVSGIFMDGGAIRLRMLKSVLTGWDNSLTAPEKANLFKTWLTSNNLLVYYALATPTTTEITDQTLLAQLENILKMHTNKNVTNISIVPTGTNAEPTAEVEYRVDLGTVIGNINNAIISLGGNV